MPRRIRAARQRLKSSESALDLTSLGSLLIVRTPGATPSPSGVSERKPTSLHFRTNRRPHFWFRWPTRWITPKQSSTTTGRSVTICGGGSPGDAAVPSGIIARSARSLTGLSRVHLPATFRGQSRSSLIRNEGARVDGAAAQAVQYFALFGAYTQLPLPIMHGPKRRC